MRKYLGKTVTVTVDRPLGSRHPESGTIYPVNYGYLAGTAAGDGEPVDAYVLGVFEPVEKFRGRVIAVIHRKDDNEDKLVVAPTLSSYSEGEIRVLTEFMERNFDSEILSCATDFMAPVIRVTAHGIARRGSQVLVTEGYDIVTDERFYRFPGGGVQFGEESTVALRREFAEELGAKLKACRYLGVLENFFTFEGKPGHQIAFFYEVDLPVRFYGGEEFVLNENNAIGKAIWVERDEFLAGRKPIYPRDVRRFL